MKFSFWKLETLLEARIKTKKKKHHVLEFNQSQCWIQHTEIMNDAVYGKTMANIRNRIDVKLVSNKKDYLKWTSKPRYMSHKICDNDLVVILENKVTLTLNKAAYIGMCILELSKY